MIGKALAITAALHVSAQVYAQTNQTGTGPVQGVTTGPAAGSPTIMRAPQAGPLATKHQRQVLHHASGSNTRSQQASGSPNGDTGAAGLRSAAPATGSGSAGLGG
jgi:hypothetical protein